MFAPWAVQDPATWGLRGQHVPAFALQLPFLSAPHDPESRVQKKDLRRSSFARRRPSRCPICLHAYRPTGSPESGRRGACSSPGSGSGPEPEAADGEAAERHPVRYSCGHHACCMCHVGWAFESERCPVCRMPSRDALTSLVRTRVQDLRARALPSPWRSGRILHRHPAQEPLVHAGDQEWNPAAWGIPSPTRVIYLHPMASTPRPAGVQAPPPSPEARPPGGWRRAMQASALCILMVALFLGAQGASGRL